jgi:hypothetical protein
MPAEEHDAPLQELRQLTETLRRDIVGTLSLANCYFG